MDGVEPEPIHQHVVEVGGVAFPPKQVMEEISGFDRRSYTTMEALRVLTKLGFPAAASKPSVTEMARTSPVWSVGSRLSKPDLRLRRKRWHVCGSASSSSKRPPKEG